MSSTEFTVSHITDASMHSLYSKKSFLHCAVCADDNIDETYGINVQFEESEEEVRFCSCFVC